MTGRTRDTRLTRRLSFGTAKCGPWSYAVVLEVDTANGQVVALHLETDGPGVLEPGGYQ